MTTAQRREEILALLNQADAPIAAKDLAARFGVSRQVIVQDLAVIRASRPNIISTNRGYILQQQETGCLREFKVRHTPEQAEQELNLIVDHGGRVKNISISHRVYGRVTAEMDIRSRQDVNEFVQAINSSHSSVLSSATSGYHYHLIEASSQERLDLIGEQLKKAGFLAPLQPWEKEKHHNI
jgi:transcriptional regulator of NAD metabolism